MSCTTRKSLAGSPSARAAGAAAKISAAASASVRTRGTAAILPGAGRARRPTPGNGPLRSSGGERHRKRLAVVAGAQDVRRDDGLAEPERDDVGVHGAGVAEQRRRGAGRLGERGEGL